MCLLHLCKCVWNAAVHTGLLSTLHVWHMVLDPFPGHEKLQAKKSLEDVQGTCPSSTTWMLAMPSRSKSYCVKCLQEGCGKQCCNLSGEKGQLCSLDLMLLFLHPTSLTRKQLVCQNELNKSSNFFGSKVFDFMCYTCTHVPSCKLLSSLTTLNAGSPGNLPQEMPANRIKVATRLWQEDRRAW